jgi:RNA polymerase sigma-70 factor (ECF subfamily)
MNEAARRICEGAEDEAALVRCAQAGDAKAFAEIVRRYQRALYRLAYGLTRSSSDADDLAQETFLRAYQALGRFRVGEPMYPWLARIATNQAFSLFRSRRRKPETALEPLIEAGWQWSGDDDPAAEAAEREHKAQLQAAFAELKPEHQAVLVLRAVQDLSYEDIAQTLQIPVGTVMSRLSRARAELKSRLLSRIGEGP